MKTISLSEYTYDLPNERIALFPLQERDQSRLLVYQHGTIDHKRFYNLPDLLPADTLLVFNNTKVIPARLHFTKDTGAVIEIFLLNPVEPSPLVIEAMQAKHSCAWQCTIGNRKRWALHSSLIKTTEDLSLKATLVDADTGVVAFHWESDHTFAELVDRLGAIPLPPYLKREAEISDKARYQTVYAKHEGAVAAPTAGLHFTPAVLEELKKKEIHQDYVTLHVSAGTFQPIKVENAIEHTMHEEQVVVTLKNIEALLHANTIIPVGTTSMRTIESLYWYGVKLLQQPDSEFTITQHDPYVTTEALPSKSEALQAILTYMQKNNLNQLTGETAIYIMPGYSFRICKGLITNFHQPGSTLILLVAALVGTDWRKIYNEALLHDYRFLSYGDSSLLLL